MFSVTTKSLNGMECSEPNKREQKIKSYAQYIAQNPEKISKEIIHIGLSAKIDNKYLNITPDKLKNSLPHNIPDEIMKNHIFSKKYSLKPYMGNWQNNNKIFLFPHGSSLFHNNELNLCIISKLNENTYSFKYFIAPTGYQFCEKNTVTTPLPSFIFNTDKDKREFYIEINNFFIPNYVLRAIRLMRKTVKGLSDSCLFNINCKENYSDPKKLSITSAIGITKNSKFILFSLTQNDQHWLKLKQLFYHNNSGIETRRSEFLFSKKKKMFNTFISELDIPTLFTTFTPLTPKIFASCTKEGDLYFIELKSTGVWTIGFFSKSSNRYYNVEICTYKQKLPKNILVKQIASNPLCPREFIFVAEKTIENENNEEETKSILYHAYIDENDSKENKIYFSEIEQLDKTPEHLGFHNGYITISNTYTDNDDFGVIVRKVPLTKRWLEIANKKQTYDCQKK